MTEAARWNLQHGVPEDKTKEWTDYTPTSELDMWILQHMENRKFYDIQREKLLQKQQEEKQMEELEKKVVLQIEKELEKLLKDFK